MQTFPQVSLVALATIALAITPINSAIAASSFSQREVEQSRFLIAASPYNNGNAHQLMIVEQLSNQRPCWREKGGLPTTIEPLLTQFDFTNICGRSIDSNGYSIRTGGEDLGWRYALRVVRQGNEMQLLGVPTNDRTAPAIVIGRINGVTSDFAKFNLEPGWRLTKRTYNGSTLGHVYLTHDRALPQLLAATGNRPTAPISRPIPVFQPLPVKPIPGRTVPVRPLPPVVAKPGTSVTIPVPPPESVTKPRTSVIVPPPAASKPINGGFKSRPGDFVVPTIDVFIDRNQPQTQD
jgi:N-acetylmuramoyl-L-alanine amidase